MNPSNQTIITGAWFPPPPQISGQRRTIQMVQSALLSEVRVGHYFGAFSAFPPDAGVAAGQRRIQVVNTGTDTASSCVARLINRTKRIKKTGQVFARVRPFAASATEKLSGTRVMPYALAVANVLGSGAAKTMDLTVDAGLITTVRNLSTQATSNSAALNVTDYYRIESGLLTDMEFLLSQAAVNADVENCLIFSPRFAQIAEDLGGAPGTWGVTDVILSEATVSGQITASGIAYYWERVLVPDGGNSASNPYILDVALQALVSTSAGWSS